jgi:hypothetical protein
MTRNKVNKLIRLLIQFGESVDDFDLTDLTERLERRELEYGITERENKDSGESVGLHHIGVRETEDREVALL